MRAFCGLNNLVSGRGYKFRPACNSKKVSRVESSDWASGTFRGGIRVTPSSQQDKKNCHVPYVVTLLD